MANATTSSAKVLESILLRYAPENATDIDFSLLESCPLCLVERSVDGTSHWVSLHESVADAVEYCADYEATGDDDGWVACELINVYSGAAYHPKRSVSFLAV